MQGRYLRRGLLGFSAVAATAWASIAAAQTTPAVSVDADQTATLEEVVVTARKREENLQETPLAITAVSEETLEARNVEDVEGIARIAPNVLAIESSGGIGSMAAFIRGVGFIDNLVGQDAPIGVYVDGVVAGRFTVGMMNLVSPERVEVLRGPQGTLFGRNTTGGAISITTHEPTDEFSGMASASYGTFNARHAQARIDTGLLGESGVKLSLAYRHAERDGTQDNLIRPSNLDPGAETSSSYWGKAVGEWGRLSATLVGDYTEITGVPQTLQITDASAAVRNMAALSPTYGGDSYTFTRSRLRTLTNDADAGEQNIWSQGVGLTFGYELNDNLSIKTISAVRAYKRFDPAAYGPADLRVNIGTVAAPVISSFNGFYGFLDRQQSQRQTTHEAQLLGDFGDFDFVAGLFYLTEKAWDYGVTRLPFALGTGETALNSISTRYYTVDSESRAAFGQVNWRPAFLAGLEVTAGIRYTEDKRDFEQFASVARTADLSTTNTSYLVSANYQWTDDMMVYLRYATGYRAGGFNARAGATANPIYLPEEIRSLEGGFKLDLLANRLRVNGAVFHNEYDDLQTFTFQPPGATAGGGGTVLNASAVYDGFELEMEALPTDALTVRASIGYVDPSYTSFPRGLEGGAVVQGCTPINNSAGVAVGQDCGDIARFTWFPKETADLSAKYEFPSTSMGNPSLFVSYSYKGKIEYNAFYLPSTPFGEVGRGDAFGLLAARFSLADIPLTQAATAEVSIFGDNLTDEDYVVQSTDYGFMVSTVFGTPRTVGIEAKVEF